jgi:hypothetical protein
VTNTNVSEAELVDLQRKALSCFQRLDNLASWVFNRQEIFSEEMADKIYTAAQLARAVSDEMDRLTDLVRTARMRGGE